MTSKRPETRIRKRMPLGHTWARRHRRCIDAAMNAVIYSAAIAWTLLGIVVANLSRQPNRTVAGFALLLVPIVFAASLIGG